MDFLTGIGWSIGAVVFSAGLGWLWLGPWERWREKRAERYVERRLAHFALMLGPHRLPSRYTPEEPQLLTDGLFWERDREGYWLLERERGQPFYTFRGDEPDDLLVESVFQALGSCVGRKLQAAGCQLPEDRETLILPMERAIVRQLAPEWLERIRFRQSLMMWYRAAPLSVTARVLSGRTAGGWYQVRRTAEGDFYLCSPEKHHYPLVAGDTIVADFPALFAVQAENRFAEYLQCFNDDLHQGVAWLIPSPAAEETGT